MIEGPFSSYHRGKLERLVPHGFDRIEAHSANTKENGYCGMPEPCLSEYEFQNLIAAAFYLQSMAKR
jgi:hypothetical protein